MSRRVLLVVTHLLGAGHLTRAAALARAFAAAGDRVTLVSGGRPAPLVRTQGLDLVQLPPVRALGTAFGDLRDEAGAPVTPARMEERARGLRGALGASDPDVVITELYPFGRRALAAEFDALLAAARARPRPPLVLASVRDVLAPPSRPERAARTLAVLAEAYDGVLVHGSAAFLPLEASWPVPAALRPRLHYTGYVDEDPAPREAAGDSLPEGAILVSAGSGEAGLPLLRAALGAAASGLISSGPISSDPASGGTGSARPWRILVGRGVPDEAFAALAAAAPPNLRLERARPDFRACLRAAALSVSAAGYNTVVDLLRTRLDAHPRPRPPAVLVPFEAGGETEQRRRAERLAAAGLAVVLPEAELDPASLAAAVARALAAPPPDLRLVGGTDVPLNGAARSVAITHGLLARRAAGRARPPPPAPDWRPLDAALAEAAARGRRIGVWWRDDDATADTPALDRLLALADEVDWPLALAAIPAGVEASLVGRLAGVPGARACVLVHGLAHANRAPEGARRAELGPGRPTAAILADAAAGLRLLRARVPGALPVLVPPWNRIAPDAVPGLAALGYLSLSTFGDGLRPRPLAPIPRLDAHLDPVAWRAGGGLADPDALIARAAAAVWARLGPAPGSDPRDGPGGGAGDADDAFGPIGLLTHHLVMDDETWRFCRALLLRLASYRAVDAVAVARVLDPDWG